MKLRKFDCEEIVLRLTTNYKDFSAKKFFRDTGLSESAADWENGAPLELLHNTSNPRASDYHVHTRLRRVKQSVQLTLGWNKPATKKRKKSAFPVAEKVPEWIEKFFKGYIYSPLITAYYLFPRTRYESCVRLPTPFWGPPTRARSVTGISVSTELRGAADSDVIIDASDDEELSILVFARFRMRLSRLKPEFFLEKFAPLVKDFVKEK